MKNGQIWVLYFSFYEFMTLSTIIAVFENIVLFNWFISMVKKKKCVLKFMIIVIGIPCAIGFSVLSNFQPLGPGSAVWITRFSSF